MPAPTCVPMQTVVSSLRRKLRDDAGNPRYIFTEIRVGYRMSPGRRARVSRATGRLLRERLS